MNKKMNNKGFSLVELIIVIAIMAVLVGVLAPQFLKYVERSRKSTDVQTVAEIISAVNVYVADPNSNVATGSDTIELSKSAVTIGGSETTLIKKALYNAGITSVALKSGEWTSDGKVTLQATVSSDLAVDYSVTSTYAKTTYDIIKGSY